MAIIQIQDVSKKFQTKDGEIDALKHVTLDIEAGDIYGIIGMSGAGKSTLVRCINHIEVPTEGTVIVQDKDLSKLSEKELRKQREHIGMIFQHFNLLMQKSVLENVCFPLFIQGKSKAEAKKKAYELLDIVGLKDRAKAYPSQLSGGQKQRVAIARALASDPQILLCDEATSALDPQTTSSILALLQDINKRFGITIVVITHQMAVVREICNRVAIMKDGQVVENGSTVEIFNHPKSEVARELLRKDDGGDTTGDDQQTASQIQDGTKIRIVFTENSAFEPVIANMILTFKEPINILKAATKNVGGMADFLRHFLRCEHLRLHAEALLEAVIVDFAIPRRDNQNRLFLTLKRERFRDAPRLTVQRLCRQSNRCAGFIEFTDAVGNPLRSKCCAYLFD